MASTPRRITQKDVAVSAGVDHSTVSLALRNHPSIPDGTRRRIRTAADLLGYRPDPMLGALASYRTRVRPVHYHGTLAWLTNWPEWRDSTHFTGYFEGAKQQAATLGYLLEETPLHLPGMTPRRLATILRARNIRGLLVCPVKETCGEIDFPWEHFATLAFGYTLASPRHHRVAPAQFQASTTIMRRLLASGRRRIGFWLSPTHDARTAHHYLAGYYTEMGLAGLEPLLHDHGWSPDETRAWLRRHRIEAIVNGGSLNRLRECGLAIPDDLVVASPCLSQRTPEVSGICEDNREIGRVAANFLVGLLQRGELGVPASPQRILVEGIWNDGLSFPLRPAETVHSTD